MRSPIDGVTGEMVADLARAAGHRDVHYVQDKTDAAGRADARSRRPGDIVVTMGAGDIHRFGQAFLDGLSGHAS